MRQRKGFTLVELLWGAILASVLGMTMLMWEGWLLRVFNRSSAWQLAHERGQRVLTFIQLKALHTGLGLSACRKEDALRRAFARSLSGTPSVPRLLTVYQDSPVQMTPATEKDGVFQGTALGLLYAWPSGVMVKRTDSSPAVPGKTVAFSLLSGDTATGISQAGFRAGYRMDLTSWCALPLAGMPFYISSAPGKNLVLSLASTVDAPVDIPLVNELYLLQFERFYVLNGKFHFQRMSTGWSSFPREEGVLALWVEWRPGIRVLDLWVLTTGGPAPLGGSAKPSEWPEDAPWRNDFTQHTLCVSRASWRLENV